MRHMKYSVQASRTFLVVMCVSFSYEFYRATVKTGVSDFDSPERFFFSLPFYLVGVGMALLLRSGRTWAIRLMLAYVVVLIAVGVFYFCPVVLMQRRPGTIDWLEAVVYLGLLFVVLVQCLNNLRGIVMVPDDTYGSQQSKER